MHSYNYKEYDTMDEITIDIDKLRGDVEDYYGTGAFNGFPAMIGEAYKVRRMSDEEVAQKAADIGFNLYDYEV